MANRISIKTLDNLARILSTNLGRPEVCYSNGSAQIGCIHLRANGYGYSIDSIFNTNGGVTSLSSTMTARECYEWLQGALAVCRETGNDGPLTERWNGSSVRTNGHHGVMVRYVGPTDHKGSRWQAKDCDKRATIYVPFADGPIAAAIKWADKAGYDNQQPRYVIQLSPDLYAVDF